ncbi:MULTISPECIES: AfsR/SARP family transcriptional regulator [Streptomyces]|uniref:AfsR/SARP family transcriptional regulator n=1 Tax=Streptomyces TaxID=1883 RepID=UPI00138AE28D|nr:MULTISPECIES: AfsR/SARP family transcriptional regulator [Streptomyces]NDK23419.1 AfsR/SARP family transcriptional regulator [Streptomyces sp. TR1341]WSI84083.1 AfsR/SARP family transcriptional regulator [Streptomyces murinus]WUD05798.1 AfsR/SARP family transcriptional regulator [Streptomyces murinus]
MEFGILGPLSLVDSDGRSCAPGALKLKILLANFLVRPNRTMSTHQLIEEIWGGFPPRTATTALQVYISNIRKILGEGGSRTEQSSILTRPPGYVFELAGHGSDLHRFEQERDEAGRLEAAGDTEGAARLLRTALRRWRGRALADVRCTPRLTAAARRLDELYIASYEKSIELELMMGRDAELVGELYALAGEYPSRERVHEFLMVALYNAGRPGEALQAYMSIRNALSEQSGLAPSHRLRGLQQAILSRSIDVLSIRPQSPMRSIA